mmetsp:Transcript_28085/g.41373  ORF Transcript_28085/g.41373 Transcript_28085/m.41373 type:complete len:433 (-) Transcript_28085:77-1375(-)|eukprot:CAMPEP_0194035560 /NCGR_PEP_ID=MMETSP0009_2-20130614/7964_1 /TAXON_ID=210454 /ORGANISM="Grammatophora oceanica, Strain CCMP 410" /LENGTH=432 /DNA_ID=CAMNT_0038676953 /DNA_START=1 /DNA_END=1299 /DNA_ORIENTATION=+
MNKVAAFKGFCLLAISALLMVSYKSTLLVNSEHRSLLNNGDPLRIAVFGSSNSWGAQLGDRFDAYPYKLSPTVDNYAYFSSGPNYPAVCLQSLLGDSSIYDLILLESYVSGAEHGLADLAARLRLRFPEAIIIVMKFYGPFDAVRRVNPDDEEYLELNKWKETLDLPDDQLNTFIKAIEADDGAWKFKKHPNADHAINQVVRESGAYQFHLPKAETTKKTLVSYMHFFDSANHMRLSEKGHNYVYAMCKEIVTKHILGTKKNRLRHVDDGHVRVGTWGHGDSCNIWLTSGGMTHVYDEDNMDLKQYDSSHGKFALEVNNPGWIDIKNTFEDSRTLYLSYITSKEVGDYPDLKVDNGSQSFVLETYVGGSDIHAVGITRTLPVGEIGGLTKGRLTLTPINTADKLYPFRLVGTTFTNTEIAPMEFGFGPLFNV